MKTYDVLIVGGGPAGLMAAGTALGRGLFVSGEGEIRISGRRVFFSGPVLCIMIKCVIGTMGPPRF